MLPFIPACLHRVLFRIPRLKWFLVIALTCVAPGNPSTPWQAAPPRNDGVQARREFDTWTPVAPPLDGLKQVFSGTRLTLGIRTTTCNPAAENDWRLLPDPALITSWSRTPFYPEQLPVTPATFAFHNLWNDWKTFPARHQSDHQVPLPGGFRFPTLSADPPIPFFIKSYGDVIREGGTGLRIGRMRECIAVYDCPKITVINSVVAARVEDVPEVQLPVELWNIKDHANTGDDVEISRWNPGEPISDANVAWIEAHSSATDDAPRMPQLEFRVPALPEGISLQAKFLVEYDRPYRGTQAEDTVRIPADGSFQYVDNGKWEMWKDYRNLQFFGGDATLTYQINGGAETTIRFAIGGRNPDEARCKAYTQSRPGAPWYAYAIQKQESECYNPRFYNQFWEGNGNSSPVNRGVNYHFTKGDPLVVRSTCETGVGGAGLAQVTGSGGNKSVSAHREIFWNWQKNVDAFLTILAGKIQEADAFMNDANPRKLTDPMPRGQRWQALYQTGRNVPVPSRVMGRVRFGDNPGEKRPEDAVAIKAYNGAAAHWCSWRGPKIHEWQWNNGSNNYVEEVCEQVEEGQLWAVVSH